MSKTTRIVITGGGTGGHIYPALAVAQALRKDSPNIDILYVGTKGGREIKIIPSAGFQFRQILVKGFGGGFIHKLGALMLLPLGCLQALFILLNYRPQLIVGTGGYVSFPIVFAGRLLGIKVILLEQNVVPGKTTKLLAKLADEVLLSFPDTKEVLPKEKVFVVGNPIREEILKISSKKSKEFFNLNSDIPTILITGASQGAKSINEAVINALSNWKDYSFQIIHLTGVDNFSEVKKRIQKILLGSKLKYLVYPYLDDIWKAYAASDLVISRAGATTLAEITACGLPAVLVPYPYSAERHQNYNAGFLESQGACVVISDDQVKQKLAGVILDLIKDRDRLSEMAANSLAQGKPDALSKVLMEIKKELKS